MCIRKQTRAVNIFSLAIVFFLQVLDNYLREVGGSFSVNAIKNVFLFGVIVLFGIELYQKKINNIRKRILLSGEVKAVIWMIGMLLCLSIFQMLKNSTISFVPFGGTLKLLLPIIAAFLIVNTFNERDIYKLMCFFLYLSIGGFICAKGIAEVCTFDFGMLSLKESANSLLESDFFSPTAMSLFIYFCYNRKSKINLLLAFIFTVMTHKRIMTLYAILLLPLCLAKPERKKIPKRIKVLFGMAFLGGTFVYIQMNLGNISDSIIQHYFGMNLDAFTMGRQWLYQEAIRNGYKSAGLMTLSSNAFVGRGPEMDLPNFYLEMGTFSLIIWIYTLLKISKNSLYGFMITTFVLLEMLTSHWADITYFWMIYYMVLGMANETITKSWRKIENKGAYIV